MRMLCVALFLISLSLAVMAQSCDQDYNQCITQCCKNCGSSLSTNAQGDLVCNVGTQANPNQECIDMCTPCSTGYHACLNANGGSSGSSASGGNSDTGGSCCGTPVIFVALLGLVFLKANK